MASPFRLLRSDLLQMDFSDFSKLALFFKRFPVQARKATAQMLNDLAFRARKEAFDVLASQQVIRNARFDQSRLRVQKTAAAPIDRQQAIIGSIFTYAKGGRLSHDGWASLQTGREPRTRSRVMTLLSRGGDISRSVLRSARLKPGTDFPKPEDWDDIPYPTPPRRIQAMIRAMGDSSAYGKTFLLPKGQSGKMSPGLYRIKSKRGYLLPATGRAGPKVLMLQRFGRKPRGPRFRWIEATIKQLMAHAPIAQMWKQAIERVMGRPQP